MAGAGRKWLKGCGIGCGATALLGVVGLLGAGMFMSRPFEAAVESQQELTAAQGDRAAYAPPADGPTAERLEAFLAVRADLMGGCEEFRAMAGRFQAMEELDKEGDVSATEALKAVAPLMGSVLGMAGDIGRYTEARNRALLDRGMGLGEYVWIYVLAYNSWLGHAPNRDIDGTVGEGALHPRERELLAGLMEAHAVALDGAGRADEAAAWRAEAAALADSETGVPFAAGGLPPALAGRLEPFRTRLEAAYCEATGSFELGQVRKEGLSFHSE